MYLKIIPSESCCIEILRKGFFSVLQKRPGHKMGMAIKKEGCKKVWSIKS